MIRPFSVLVLCVFMLAACSGPTPPPRENLPPPPPSSRTTNVGTVVLVDGRYVMQNRSGGDLSQSKGGTLMWQAAPGERLRFTFVGVPLTELGTVVIEPEETLTRTIKSDGTSGCYAYTVERAPASEERPSWVAVEGVGECGGGRLDTRPKIIVE